MNSINSGITFLYFIANWIAFHMATPYSVAGSEILTSTLSSIDMLAACVLVAITNSFVENPLPSPISFS